MQNSNEDGPDQQAEFNSELIKFEFALSPMALPCLRRL
jgi:hypothetical protein